MLVALVERFSASDWSVVQKKFHQGAAQGSCGLNVRKTFFVLKGHLLKTLDW